MERSRGSRQLLETKEEARSAIARILKGDNSRFQVVPFEKFNTVAKLRSRHYNGYFVICHTNTLRSAG